MVATPQGDRIEGLGTPGTPVGQVVTVQGAAAGTALPVDTELPAAVALSSDTVANPTAPAVGAFGLVYDAANNWWSRVRAGLGNAITASRTIRAGATTFRSANPAVNVVATLTFAAAAGRQWQLHGLVATLRSTAAVGVGANLRVWDGATGTTLIGQFDLSIPATAFAVDRLAVVGVDMLGSIGLAMTIDFGAAAGANTIETIVAWAHQSV